jgi:hypothetical protein
MVGLSKLLRNCSIRKRENVAAPICWLFALASIGLACSAQQGGRSATMAPHYSLPGGIILLDEGKQGSGGKIDFPDNAEARSWFMGFWKRYRMKSVLQVTRLRLRLPQLL